MGIYELHLQYALKEMLNEGDVFYDVGANNGYLSLLGARCVGDEGFVYAFEPLPQNAQNLRKLMLENHVSNYKLIQLAVSNQSGSIEFYASHDKDSCTPSLIRNGRTQVMQVVATTLDEFAAEHRRPSLIKIDIEGAETMALEGASTILNDVNVPKWLIETHSAEMDRRVREILLDHGYRLYSLPAPILQKPYPTHIAAYK